MNKCSERIAYSSHDRLHQARGVLCGDDGVLCGKCVRELRAALVSTEAKLARIEAVIDEEIARHRHEYTILG